MTATNKTIRRMVLYTTGDLDDQAASLNEYAIYAEAHGWQVIKERTDLDVSDSAWLRKGILSCITIVCHGNAEGVLMPEATFKTFSASDQEWLRLRIQRFGGFLHVITPTNEAPLCAPTTSLQIQTR
jgi:hypothetical protein